MPSTRSRGRRGGSRRGAPESIPKATLRTTLHAGQRAIAQSRSRFRVVACGRQWGKTRLGCPLGLYYAMLGERGFWVAPDYKRANIGWRILKQLAEQIPAQFVTIREADRRIEITTDTRSGWVEVRSAHVPGQLRAETLDFAIVDEAAFLERQRWDQELRPTLAVRKGWALFLSTFQGENYFYNLYELGMSDEFPDWQSWRHPSVDNPFIDVDEVELARRTTPAAEFAQEWEASPLVYVGAVFDGETVQAAIEAGANARYDPEQETYLGIDWGYTNPTVVLVSQEHATSGEITWIDEHTWHSTQLETRIERIVGMVRKYRVLGVYADAAGKDENVALAAAIVSAGGRDPIIAKCEGVVQVRFNKWKDTGIKTRRWYLEQGLERIGPKCSELARTSKRYHYKEAKDGKQTEDVDKVDDHHVDAATAFYASRRGVVIGD